MHDLHKHDLHMHDLHMDDLNMHDLHMHDSGKSLEDASYRLLPSEIVYNLIFSTDPRFLTKILDLTIIFRPNEFTIVTKLF